MPCRSRKHRPRPWMVSKPDEAGGLSPIRSDAASRWRPRPRSPCRRRRRARPKPPCSRRRVRTPTAPTTAASRSWSSSPTSRPWMHSAKRSRLARLRLARINLPIALFYAGRQGGGGRRCASGEAGLSRRPAARFVMGLAARLENRPTPSPRSSGCFSSTRRRRIDGEPCGRLTRAALRGSCRPARARTGARAVQRDRRLQSGHGADRLGDADAAAQAMQRFETMRAAEYAVTYSQKYLEQGRYAEAVASTGAEPERGPSGRSSSMSQRCCWARPDRAAAAAPAARWPDSTLTAISTSLSRGRGCACCGMMDRWSMPGGVRRGRALGPLDGAVAGDFDNGSRPDLLSSVRGGASCSPSAAGVRAIAFKGAEPAARRRAQPRSSTSTTTATSTSARGPRAAASGAGQAQGCRTCCCATTATAASAISRRRGLAGAERARPIAPTDFDNRRDIDISSPPGAPPASAGTCATALRGRAAAGGLPGGGVH